jgi:hypothetical protein
VRGAGSSCTYWWAAIDFPEAKESRIVRRRIGMAAAAVAGVTGLVLVTIGTAAAAGKDRPQQASVAHPTGQAAARPGNNGTVKLHNGAEEPSPVTPNQPHVCTFHIHALGFDPAQVLSFDVISWPPTGTRSTVLSGKITADAAGAGRAPEHGTYSLHDGHYRLDVDTGNGTPTQDKHKVFWVKCTQTTSESGGSPGQPGAPRKPARVVSSPHDSVPPSTPATVAAAGLAPAQPGTTRLASTGFAAFSPLTTAGAGLLVLGLVLTVLSRRRSTSLHRAR